MKVMHVEAGRHLYGGAKQVLHIIEGLNELGVKNVLVCPPQSDIASQVESPTELDEVVMKGDLDIFLVWRLLKSIQKHDPDIVHLHSRRGADVFGGMAAKLAHVPAVLSRRVDNPESEWVSKHKYGLYEHVITISEAIKRVLLSQQVDVEKISCVHSSIVASEFQFPAQRARFKDEFGVSEDALVIGMIAQLIKRKGHRYLLEVLPTLVQKYPDLQVVIFGQGPLDKELQQHFSDSGLNSHVTFAGFRTDLPRWLGCLDLVVHPVDMEGLGVSLLQAAAAGVAIVGSNAGGVPEVVRHGDNGLIVEPGDTEHLERAIDELLSDPNRRKVMGENGKLIVSSDFSVEKMVVGNLDVYQRVLAKA